MFEIIKILFLILFGFTLLLKAADIFVDNAVLLAKKLRVSEFLIGLTIVALGTSIPELIINLVSSFEKESILAGANILGSNISNICIIIGITALIKEIKIDQKSIDFDLPFTLLTGGIFSLIIIFFGFKLTAIGGIILISLFFIYFTLTLKKRNHNTFILKQNKKMKFTFLPFLISLVFMIIGGKMLVDNTVNLSIELKINEGLLGLTLLAVGSSLPELITSIIAVKKGNTEIGLGNIIGSNIINLLLILGISSFINPVPFDSLKFDILIFLVVTFVLFILSRLGKKYYFSKSEGIILLIIYLMFLIFNVIELSM